MDIAIKPLIFLFKFFFFIILILSCVGLSFYPDVNPFPPYIGHPYQVICVEDPKVVIYNLHFLRENDYIINGEFQIFNSSLILLRFNNLTIEDTGKYFCVGDTIFGTITTVHTIELHYADVISIDPFDKILDLYHLYLNNSIFPITLKINEKLDKFYYLNCPVMINYTKVPPESLIHYWYRNRTLLTNANDFFVMYSNGTLKISDTLDNAIFTCFAFFPLINYPSLLLIEVNITLFTNLVSSQMLFFELKYIIIICIFLILIFLLIITCIVFLFLFRWKFTSNNTSQLSLFRMPYWYSPKQEAIEVSRNQLVLTDIIAKGRYSDLYISNLKNKITVAKLFDLNVNSIIDKQIFHEIHRQRNLYKSLPKNPYILKLIGIISMSKPYVLVLEYMNGGDLGNFLKIIKSGDLPQWYLRLIHSMYLSEYPTHVSNDFWFIIISVCNAMVYLENLKIVHKRLSLNKILLQGYPKELYIKISCPHSVLINNDYFDSISNFSNDYFLSPESINKREFSSLSDVYSFCLICINIFALGEQINLHLSKENVINKKFNSKCPLNISPALYSIVLQGVSYDPFCRPSFTSLLQELRNILNYNDNVSKFIRFRLKEDITARKQDGSIFENAKLVGTPPIYLSTSESKLCEKYLIGYKQSYNQNFIKRNRYPMSTELVKKEYIQDKELFAGNHSYRSFRKYKKIIPGLK